MFFVFDFSEMNLILRYLKPFREYHFRMSSLDFPRAIP
jgi:hypothetical protein